MNGLLGKLAHVYVCVPGCPGVYARFACVCVATSPCARRVRFRFQGHSVDDRALALLSLTVSVNLSIPIFSLLYNHTTASTSCYGGSSSSR